MAITYTREGISGTVNTLTATYYCYEDTNESISYTDATYGAIEQFIREFPTLRVTDWQLETRGRGQDSCLVTVIHNANSSPLGEPDPAPSLGAPGEIRNRVEFHAEPKFVLRALEAVHWLPSTIGPNGTGFSTLLVNVQADDKELQAIGMNVNPPPVVFTKEYRWLGQVTDDYIKTIAETVGKTNSDNFFGYPPGQLFLAMASVFQQDTDTSTLVFGFAYDTEKQRPVGDLGTLTVPPFGIYWTIQRPKKIISTDPGTGKNIYLTVPVETYAISQRIYESAAFGNLKLPDAPAPKDRKSLDLAQDNNPLPISIGPIESTLEIA